MVIGSLTGMAFKGLRRSSRRTATFALAAASTLVAFAPRAAWADGAPVTTQTCIDANAKAQELRRESKFAATRAALNLCVNSQCPSMVRDDCTRRLDDLDRAQPTIVFSVKDENGADVGAVKVSIDGRKLTDRLDGATLAVDPGSHAFTFEPQGQPPITRQLIIHEGERGRLETIAVAAPGSGAVPAAHGGTGPRGVVFHGSAALDPTPVDASAQSGQAQRIWGFTLGGVGVAGIAAGAALGLVASAAWNDAKNDCGAVCSPQNHSAAESDHDRASTFAILSTVGFVAGGALVALGGILVLSAPHASGATTPSVGWSVVPQVGLTGAELGLKGEF
jgi:hypothetical protein